MAIKINFDATHTPENPTFILMKRNGALLGLINAQNITLKDSMSVPEISFTVYKQINDIENLLWDQIKNFKLLYCPEYKMCFEITVDTEESSETIKQCYGRQLAQSELSQIMLYNIEINTEDDIARENYIKPTVLYNEEDKSISLLDRIMEKATHYNIAHVDDTIKDIQRTFKFDNKSLYDSFQEIAQEIGCLFVFDSDLKNGTITRDIYVYDLQTNCLNCGYRGDYHNKCPMCDSTNLHLGYGEDTTIFLTSDELAQTINLKSNTDAVKNCFKLEAGDNLMTATIRNCNPNGTDYLWYLDALAVEDMSNELSQALSEYQEDYNYYKDEYELYIDGNLLEDYNLLVTKYRIYDPDLQRLVSPLVGYENINYGLYNTIDFESYLKSELMPSISISDTSAAIELSNLTTNNLSPSAVSNLTSLSLTTANNSVLSFAKCFVNRDYQVKIAESSLTIINDEYVWQGKFTVTNFSDEEDTATNDTYISIVINDDYQKFVMQKIQKNLCRENGEPIDLVSLFAKELIQFKNEIRKYSLDGLNYLQKSCQGVIDILIEQGVADQKTWSGQNPNLYTDLYIPYYNKLNALNDEIQVRENELAVIIGVTDINGTLIEDGVETILSQCVRTIQTNLNIENYLDDQLWAELASFRREQKYSNSNYISDGLTNAELFEKANEFITVAENEIYKSATLQHTITTTLNNLLVIDKFKVLLNKFKTGNWLRIQIDDEIYKLRLVDYELKYDNIESLSVTFSDVLKSLDELSDQQSIINKMTSITGSYNYTQHQASQGSKSNEQIEDWHNKGIDLTSLNIINDAANQDVIMDDHGILCRQFNEDTQLYNETQLKILNTTIAITDDNWLTTKTAVGKFYYKDPVDNQIKSAYGINGELLMGNLIIGQQLGIYADDNSMTFDSDGLTITNDVNTLSVNPNSDNLFVLSNQNADLIYVGTNGELHIKGNGDIQSLNYVANTSGMKINLSDGSIDSKNFKVDSNGSATLNDVTINSGTIKSSNYVVNQSGMKIDLSNGSIDSLNFKVDSTGSVTIGSGIIQSSNFALDNSGNVVAGTKIDLSDGSIATKNFTLSSTGVGTFESININSGIIKSQNYQLNTSGMKIDLDNGTLSSKNFNIQSDGSVLIKGSNLTLVDGSLRAEEIYGAYLSIHFQHALSGMFSSRGTSLIYFSQGNYDIYVGDSSENLYLRGTNIYANSSPISTASDQRLKKNIKELSDVYIDVIKEIKPVSFHYRNELSNSNRTHTGFIAQQVLEVLNNHNISTTDFAAFVDINQDGNEYALRYEEFIALLLAYIQQLDKRIQTIENNN